MSPELEHFMEALIATIPRATTADRIELFDDDLTSPTGMPNRRPFTSLERFDRFHAIGLSFLSARSAVQSSASTRVKNLRLRSLKVSDRLEQARLLSWHHRYVLRERLRRLIDLFKDAENSPVSSLEKVAARYKKDTDKLLRMRHRGVHEYDHHDPHIRQVEIFELLALRPLPEGPALKAQKAAKRAIERRAKSVVTADLLSEEQSFLQVTDQAFADAYTLRSVWRFAP